MRLRIEEYPGSIDQYCELASALANKLECTVVFDFNGVECMIGQYENPIDLSLAYQRAFHDPAKGKRFAYASGEYLIK